MRNLVYQVTATNTKGLQATIAVTLTVPDRYDLDRMQNSLTRLATAKAEADLGWKFSRCVVDGPEVRC